MLDLESVHFPPNFLFGACTEAYQCEGRGDQDGRGISMWDEFAHAHPKNIRDRSTADETCDSYNKFEEDVFLLKSMHANSYNFTLSWSRILPDGTTRFINKKGLDYYDDLINTLLENGVEPIVTLSDMDMPLALLKKYAGGWMNRKLTLAFESYAKLCFAKFGDRVRQWITVSQPWSLSWNSYAIGVHPPNLSLGCKGAYLALTNLLKAHAAVYRLYEKRFRQSQCGKVGISISCDSREKDSVAHQLGRVMYPLVHGKYPDYLTDAAEADTSQSCSMLIQSGWAEALKGSFDFVALHFSPQINVLKLNSGKESPSSSMTMSNVLATMKSEYGNPEVLVFCTGPRLASPTQMMDIDRAQYFNYVAKNILEANVYGGCNVRGYFPGKLLDSWELTFGYTVSYGLFHVEFATPTKKRSPRASVVFVLKHLFKEKKLQTDLF